MQQNGEAMLKTTPAVFAVGHDYQIMVPVTAPSLFWVKVGDDIYYDESNGILRSLVDIHRVTVPQSALDAAGEYTVVERVIIDRKPYFPEIADEEETTFKFYPVPEKGARAYHVSDAHNRDVGPVKAARVFGDVDFLILNGDIPDHSGTAANFDTIYKIAEGITRGEKPIVFARGNHDLRGTFAEKFADFTPQENGNTYYTFRIGSIWGIILDCGEDKDDGHAEYGGTVACHVFRERQTKFIEKVIERAADEYEADGVKTRLVVAHNPFTHQLPPPFNIEAEIYTKWASLLGDNVKPHAMICGHFHKTEIFEKGSENDHLGQPCTVVVGARPDGDGYYGSGFVFGDEAIEVTFTGENGYRSETHAIEK